MSGPSGLSWWARRKWRKARKHLLHEAAHARHMREDIADPARIADLDAAVAAFEQAWAAGGTEAEIEGKAGEMQKAARTVFPPRNAPKVREWVEVVAVALGVALGFRTYFLQPYKIPTGSMQPTMFGVTSEPAEAIPGWRQALWFPIWFVTGERPVEIVAKESGFLRTTGQRDDTFLFYRVGNGKPFKIHSGLPLLVGPDGRVTKGQVIARGYIRSGDQLFVNRVRYNFTRPRLGDIAVFATAGIRTPGVNPNQFYIKRIVGLPNETLQIAPPGPGQTGIAGQLMADGKPRLDPPQFARQHSGRNKYVGYQFYGQLSAPGKSIELMSDEYLFCGDNTLSSEDGRKFGGVQRDYIIGPASFVFWPLSRIRWAD